MREALSAIGRPLRPVLDAVYNACGAIAALFLLAILGIIVTQIVARWSGIAFPGSTDYAGYCMAAASFFAMAYTLNHGAHIRVSLFLQRFTGDGRRIAELWCFGIGTLLAAYFAWYAVKAVRISHMLNDISQGQDATPLWIPQIGMAAGTVLLAVALLDHFLCILVGGTSALTGDKAASARRAE